MYTLPFYTNNTSLEGIVRDWSKAPDFALELHRTSAPLWVQIYSQRPPIILLGVDEVSLWNSLIKKIYSSASEYRPYIVAVSESAEESIFTDALQQGADRVFSIQTCSARIFQSMVRSLLPKIRDRICYPPYSFHNQTQTVSIRDEAIHLRYRTFKFAHFLFVNNGSLVSKQTLLREVWGLEHVHETRRTDSQACLIRKCLWLDGSHGWKLRTGRGYGWGLFNDKSFHGKPLQDKESHNLLHTSEAY